MEFVEQFIKSLISQKKQPSPLTVKNYKADIRHFISWFEKEFMGSFSPNSLTPQIIDLYKKSNTVSARSMDRHLSALRKFFSFAKDEGIITQNPFKQTTVSAEALAKEDPWKLKDFKNYLYVYNASPLTIKNYISDIQQFLKIEHTTLEEYKERLIQIGLSGRSINRKLSSLRKYLVWAQEEGLIPRIPILSHPQTNTTPPVEYSSFPPARLFKKTILGINIFFDQLIIYPLARIALWTQRGKPLFQEHFSVASLPKELYAPLSISTKNFSWHKKVSYHLRHTRPQWYKRYHQFPVTHYFHTGLLVICASAITILLYQTVLKDYKKESVLGLSNEIYSTRTIFFEGRISDTKQVPINKTVPVKFALYNDPFLPTPIWQEVQTVNPNGDGVFAATLGSKNPLLQRLFTDNVGLYLGISIEPGPELLPRQQIPTAAYAANAAAVDGLPVITQVNAPTKNVVLALDSSGNLTIGNAASPVFQATGGQFTLLGQSILLTTIPGSNGDTIISPDGEGKIDTQKPIHNTSNNTSITGVVGAVEIADLLSILATSSGQSALTVNQNGTGPIVSASSSGTAKFTLDSDGTTYIAGNVGIGTKNPIAKLQVSGDIAPSENGTYNLGSPSLRFDTLYANTIIASASGTFDYWQRKEGAMAPTTITDALNLGATATSSAIVHLAAIENQNSFIRSGNVGIGTSSPNYKLDVTGSINATGDIYKNGTTYNNPDYVLEKWATGNIALNVQKEGASTYPGIMSLEDTQDFVLTNFQLPRVASANGIFERGDILLEKVEEAYIHLFNLNRKISTKLISPIADIDKIHTNIISPLASETVTIDGHVVIAKDLEVQGNATFSGELRARKIIVDDIDTSATASAKLLSSALLSPDELASYSGQLSLEVLNASFGKFAQGLTALGPTSLTDTTITGNLDIGKYLTIADTSINVLGANLELQPMRQGGISFLSGLVIIDTQGNLAISGNAFFEQNVNVTGTLSAGSINSIGDLIASGAATIKKLNFEGVSEAIAISDIEISASSAAGIATISAQRSTLTINNPLVTDKSLIYITPRDETENQVLYLLRQEPNVSFTVGIQKPAAKEIPFNWLIVN